METDADRTGSALGVAASHNGVIPSVVISLDFELRWGLHDRLGANMEAYRENLENVQGVVPALLQLFSDHGLRATWACVGALACANWSEYFSRAPTPPHYHNPRLAMAPGYADLDPEGRLHFAPKLLQYVKNTPGQELATHTFSHIYMQEPGVTSADITADLEAVSLLWTDQFGSPPKSLVFPRNQYAFLPVITDSTVKIWRGPEASWLHNRNRDSTIFSIHRPLRLLESLNPLVRHATRLQDGEGLAMTRASLFLRTNLPGPAWNLHMMRIRRELNRLRPEEIFHIWWHPHNLGGFTKERLTRVEQVLEAIAERKARNLLETRCMEDLVL